MRREEDRNASFVIMDALSNYGDQAVVPLNELAHDTFYQERPLWTLLGFREFRLQAVIELGDTRSEAAIPPLLSMLNAARDDLQAMAAIEAFRRIGSLEDEAAIAALAKHTTSSNREVRLLAVRALGTTRSVTALAPLMTFAESADEQRQQMALIEALSHLRHPQIEPVLEDFKESAGEALVRVYAAEVLGEARNGSARMALETIVIHGPPMDASHAIRELARIGEVQSAPVIRDRCAEILNALSPQDSETLIANRSAIVPPLFALNAGLEALGQLDAPVGLPVFLQAAALRPLSGDKAVKEIALGSHMDGARQRAIVGLGYSKSAAAFDTVRAALSDSDWRVQQQAMLAAANLSLPDAAVLIAPLLEGDHGYRRVATMVLGRLGDRRAIPALVARLVDQGESEFVRRQVALSLAFLADASALAPLLDVAQSDPDQDMRLLAGESAKILQALAQ